MSIHTVHAIRRGAMLATYTATIVFETLLVPFLIDYGATTSAVVMLAASALFPCMIQYAAHLNRIDTFELKTRTGWYAPK